MTQIRKKITELDPARRPLRFALSYVLVLTVVNLVWEIAQLPLYTLWTEASLAKKTFAILHCTIGDGLIGSATLALARLAFGGRRWPAQHYWRVALAATLLGIAYLIFSEWLNVSLRGSWAYRDAMPTVGPLATGLAPLLQWVILPPLVFLLKRKVRLF